VVGGSRREFSADDALYPRPGLPWLPPHPESEAITTYAVPTILENESSPTLEIPVLSLAAT
jgi:hypothetical protein